MWGRKALSVKWHWTHSLLYLHSPALCLTHPHWALRFCWVNEKEKLHLFKQVTFICKLKKIIYLVNHTYSFILHVFNYISLTFIYLITVFNQNAVNHLFNVWVFRCPCLWFTAQESPCFPQVHHLLIHSVSGDISSNNLFLPLHSSCLSFFFFLFLFCWISYWWNQIKMNWQALLCNVNLKNLLLQEKPLWCFCHLILTVCRYWDFLPPLNCNFSPKW